jgi:hypothetical protein
MKIFQKLNMWNILGYYGCIKFDMKLFCILTNNGYLFNTVKSDPVCLLFLFICYCLSLLFVKYVRVVVSFFNHLFIFFWGLHILYQILLGGGVDRDQATMMQGDSSVHQGDVFTSKSNHKMYITYNGKYSFIVFAYWTLKLYPKYAVCPCLEYKVGT